MKFTVKTSNKNACTPNHYLSGFVIDEHEINALIGKVLTIIEAIGLDEKQEQSLKDIIKQAIREGIGIHSNSVMTRELIDLIYSFNRQLHEQIIKEDKVLPDELGACLRDGDYELTFVSKY